MDNLSNPQHEADLEEMKKDKDIEISRLTANMAQIEANLMGKIAKLEADLVDGKERNRELERKIAETKRKNDDLEAQMNSFCNFLLDRSEPNTEVRDGKAKIGELEGKINALQSKISVFETQMQFEREKKTAEMVKLQADLNRTRSFLELETGWSYLAKTASWYKAFDQEMKFDEAEAYCASRKGHLVSIHSQEENDFVWKLAKTVDSDYGFWIRLKRNPDKGNAFEWTDGSSVDFTNWHPGQPNSYTIQEYNFYTHAQFRSIDGKWFSEDPTFKRFVICKKSFQF
ncbi:unnamed protein product, partial [Mesorhabditis belari]|uniref:C-type lectin domain-containing protein n=1 Tax=Mesorhabditis belari TaxID=2138241 RepID=A0AAF3EQJ6_9BILA